MRSLTPAKSPAFKRREGLLVGLVLLGDYWAAML